MEVKWLLEKDVFDEDLEDLYNEIDRQGMEYKTVTYRPFDLDQDFHEYFAPDECVVCYGSVNFIQRVQRNAQWIPGAFFHKSSFKCSTYYPHFMEPYGGKYRPTVLLNHKHIYLPFGSLYAAQEYLLGYGSIFSHEEGFQVKDIFIRPDLGAKSFVGQVVSEEEFNSFLESQETFVDADTMCLISRAKNIRKEYRFFISENTILTGSLYKVDGKSVRENFEQGPVIEFLSLVLEKYSFRPDRVFVVDVAEMTKPKRPLDNLGHFKIIELNAASCSGLYACNKRIFVEEMARQALAEREEYF